MMNAVKNKSIAIVGGGPGGLTLARILQLGGAVVQVYERDSGRNVRVQGATLDLHEDSGLKALEEAGLMHAFKANYRPGADKLRITDKHATILFDDAANGQNELRPEIDRGPLRDILLDSLAEGTVVWERHFLALKQQGGGYELLFKNGATAYADLVVAADGANSIVRPYITPIRPFYAGITIVEGTVYHSEKSVPRIHELLNGGKIFAVGDEKTLIVSSKGDGSLVFYTGCKTDERWTRDSSIDFSDQSQVLAWFQRAFAGWDAMWEALFIQAESFIPRPQYAMPLNQSWDTISSLTMLGDAAHLMPPYAGEGVNMAMLDALELGKALVSNDYPDSYTAIASYERAMRLRASETAKMTMDQTLSLHSKDGLDNLLSMFREVG